MARKKPQVIPSPEVRKAYLQDKVRNLFREIIGGLKLEDIKFPETLEGQDRIDFAKYCHETYHGKYFKVIRDTLYYAQIMHIGEKARDADEMSFNRATANGINLVEELFHKWANIYDDDYSTDSKNRKFDAKKAFETINEQTT